MPHALHLGHGIGLRTPHYARFVEERPAVDWVEVITENFLVAGGQRLRVLEAVRRDRPVVLHGVSLSIGAIDPLNGRYLKALKALAARIEPAWVSDHLCWGSIDGHYAHDLLPLPLTDDALDHVTARIHEVQECLGRPLVLENPSTYVAFAGDTIPEQQFLGELARRTGCKLLLDVNNVVVSAFNHGFSINAYLGELPVGAVQQLHLAGHSDRVDYLFDTHDAAVPESVCAAYRAVLRRFGPLPTLIERDDRIPSLEELLGERDLASSIESEETSASAA